MKTTQAGKNLQPLSAKKINPKGSVAEDHSISIEQKVTPKLGTDQWLFSVKKLAPTQK